MAPRGATRISHFGDRDWPVTIFAGFFVTFFLRYYGTLGVLLFIAGAMVIVFVVIPSMGPRTTRPRLEAMSR